MSQRNHRPVSCDLPVGMPKGVNSATENRENPIRTIKTEDDFDAREFCKEFGRVIVDHKVRFYDDVMKLADRMTSRGAGGGNLLCGTPQPGPTEPQQNDEVEFLYEVDRKESESVSKNSQKNPSVIQNPQQPEQESVSRIENAKTESPIPAPIPPTQPTLCAGVPSSEQNPGSIPLKQMETKNAATECLVKSNNSKNLDSFPETRKLSHNSESDEKIEVYPHLRLRDFERLELLSLFRKHPKVSNEYLVYFCKVKKICILKSGRIMRWFEALKTNHENDSVVQNVSKGVPESAQTKEPITSIHQEEVPESQVFDPFPGLVPPPPYAWISRESKACATAILELDSTIPTIPETQTNPQESVQSDLSNGLHFQQNLTDESGGPEIETVYYDEFYSNVPENAILNTSTVPESVPEPVTPLITQLDLFSILPQVEPTLPTVPEDPGMVPEVPELVAPHTDRQRRLASIKCDKTRFLMMELGLLERTSAGANPKRKRPTSKVSSNKKRSRN